VRPARGSHESGRGVLDPTPAETRSGGRPVGFRNQPWSRPGPRPILSVTVVWPPRVGVARGAGAAPSPARAEALAWGPGLSSGRGAAPDCPAPPGGRRGGASPRAPTLKLTRSLSLRLSLPVAEPERQPASESEVRVRFRLRSGPWHDCSANRGPDSRLGSQVQQKARSQGQLRVELEAPRAFGAQS
jgi:hypothetical protein